jgi:hypothetical protein
LLDLVPHCLTQSLVQARVHFFGSKDGVSECIQVPRRIPLQYAALTCRQAEARLSTLLVKQQANL